MATFRRAVTLGHRGNLGVDVESVTFAVGDAVEVLERFETRVLVRDAEGRLFNVPEDALDGLD